MKKNIIWSNLLFGIEAVSWALFGGAILEQTVSISLLILIFCYTAGFYIFDRIDVSDYDEINNPERSSFYKKHKKTFRFVLIVFAGLIVACTVLEPQILLPSLFGILPCVLYPKRIRYKQKMYSLKSVFGMKVFLVAFLWAFLSIYFPSVGFNWSMQHWLMFFYAFTLVSLQIHTNDRRDIKGDAKHNVKTFAVALGEKNAIVLSVVFILIGGFLATQFIGLWYAIFSSIYLFMITLFYKPKQDQNWQILIQTQALVCLGIYFSLLQYL